VSLEISYLEKARPTTPMRAWRVTLPKLDGTHVLDGVASMENPSWKGFVVSIKLGSIVGK
jgi:hypothetical protein